MPFEWLYCFCSHFLPMGMMLSSPERTRMRGVGACVCVVLAAVGWVVGFVAGLVVAVGAVVGLGAAVVGPTVPVVGLYEGLVVVNWDGLVE